MKPTVFLSHSSVDGSALTALKRMLNKKTGHAVQFFLSIDGQSIPLGENWVHSIELALNDTAMMLVFLSPASVPSRWIHFEAGYAYAKGVRVVPVAFSGLSIADLRPPISLLQGLELRSADGLNNVIALINERFAFSFVEDFNTDDYTHIFGGQGSAGFSPSGGTEFVREIELDVPGDPVRMLAAVTEALKTVGVEYSADATDVRAFGATFTTARPRGEPPRIDARIEPDAFEDIRGAADALLVLRRGVAHLRLTFPVYVDRVREFHKISSLLKRSGVGIDNDGSFRFGDLTFRLTGREYSESTNYRDDDEHEAPREGPVLEFMLASDTIGVVPFEVTKLLWQRGVLRISRL